MNPENDRDIILVIDDETVIVDSIIRTLSGDNYQIYSANNGQIGLELLEKYKPILILLDLRMPVMDGLEFLNQIDLKPDDPYGVIVLTGHGTMEHMQKCYRFGVHAFLRKPFNIFELKGLVKNTVTMKKYQMQLASNSEQLEDMVEEKTKNIIYLNNFLDTIFHTVPIGIAVIDKDGDIIRYNSTLQKLLNGDDSQISSDNINYLLSSVSPNDLRDILISSENGSTEYFESDVQRYDSKTFPAMIACTQFIKANEKKGYLVSITDLTDQKALAHEIAEQRMALIAQDRLRMLGEFAAGVAHEVKNPLFGLKIATDLSIKMINQGKANDEILTRNLNDIANLADTMNQIITRIGNFAHQKDDQDLSSVDVYLPLNQAIEMLNKQFKQENVDVSLIKSDVPLIRANPLGLQQIIVNILTNARDAINLKAESLNDNNFGKSIVIDVFKSLDESDVVISIADNGSGIPEEIIDKIFDSYFTTKNVGSGLGVGLSISKKIIESFNGKIDIKSEIGEGSVFKIMFPIIDLT